METRTLCWITTMLLAVGLVAYAIPTAPLPPGAVNLGPGKIARRVLLPNGHPAVGAKVTVRIFNDTFSLKQEMKAVTDAQGLAIFDYVAPQTRTDRRVTDYLMVDHTGYALLIDAFPGPEGPNTADLRLIPAYTVLGQVITKEKTEIPDAQVAVICAPGADGAEYYLNSATHGVGTTELAATTNYAGFFRFRGISSSGGAAIWPTTLYALGTANKRAMAAATTLTFTPPNLVQGGVPPQHVVVTPALSISGTLSSTTDGQPVRQASVFLDGNPLAHCFQAVTTDVGGDFLFSGLPASLNYALIGRHKDFADVIYPVKPPATGTTAECTLRMRPLLTIAGKVVDEETGQAPVIPVLVSTVYQRGGQTGAEEMTSAIAVTDDNGVFQLKVPAGTYPLTAYGLVSISQAANYPWGGVLPPLVNTPYKGSCPAVTVPLPEGQPTLVVKVQKQPGCLFTFFCRKAENAPGYQYRVRQVGSTEVTTIPLPPLVFIPTEKWGEKREISVYCPWKKEETMLWTEIIADPGAKNWLRLFELP